MKHKDYWRKRFEQLEEAQNNKSIKYYLELEKQYKLAMSNIERDILIWYNRFTENEGISLLEAKKLLNTRELEEFKWSVEEYIKYGKENAINQKWMKELENASARVHITRLEALKLQIQQQVEVLYGNELDGIDKLMRDIYTSGYYHTAFNVQ
ncbi:phage head morphogenesis protein, partial [Clostridioides difficile]